MKSLKNEANGDSPETTDTLCPDKYDTSRTNRDDSIENVKSMKKTNDDKKYKRDNSQHQDGNKSFIKKTKKTKHWLNGWCLWIPNRISYNMW